MLGEEERKRIENRKRKHCRLARQLLNLAVELRKARRRLTAAAKSRPDLCQTEVYGQMRSQTVQWTNTLLELAARLALPPWVSPAEGSTEPEPTAEE